MKKLLQYRIFLHSPMLAAMGNRGASAYAPTQHGPFNDRPEANTFARRNLKLEENLGGRTPFEVRPI